GGRARGWRGGGRGRGPRGRGGRAEEPVGGPGGPPAGRRRPAGGAGGGRGGGRRGAHRRAVVGQPVRRRAPAVPAARLRPHRPGTWGARPLGGDPGRGRATPAPLTAGAAARRPAARPPAS